MIKKKPTLEAFCRTEAIEDFRALLGEISNFAPENDRRKRIRVARKLILVVQPLDKNFQPTGEAFKAMTDDVSANGLGFKHTSKFPTEFVRIGPTKHSVTQAICRVCYNKPLCGREKLFRIGVEFSDEE